jgi:hypothetical protein
LGGTADEGNVFTWPGEGDDGGMMNDRNGAPPQPASL